MAMRFDLEVVIERPVDEVFAYVTDVRNLPKWQESAIAADWEGDAPVAKGSRLHERRSFLGRTAENELEVTAYEPARRFDLKSLRGPVRFQVAHTFEPTNGGTRLHVVVEGETGGAMRFAGAMVKRQAERQFRGDLERLKERLES
jgi:uncharacterized membrane protein